MIFLPRGDNNGFTLVEVMISMLMSAIVVVAIYSSSQTQEASYRRQDQVVSTQQNVRAAMLMMAREIRKAGYDPNNTMSAGFTTATSNQITFTYDDDTGALASTTYLLYTVGNVQKLGRQNPTQTQPVAEYIAGLEFYYTMADDSQTLTPATLANIRAVQLTVLAQSPDVDQQSTGVQSFTTPAGQTWTLAPGYRGRQLTMNVQCRNMGL